ncbi:MAG TPA: hypothetical protein GXZ89_05965 [Fastidiosipila sp.]|nr:hypothetical protein [Fastidiosipila sp.]
MKKTLGILLSALLCLSLVIGIVPMTVAADTAVEDRPEDRYDATVDPRTGANETAPLVVSTGTLDGKFSPFFYTSAYDNDVQGLTQLPLITGDKDGAPIAGVDEASIALSFEQTVNDDETATDYKFVLKKGVKFSDGVEVTAKDVLFTFYVLSDPAFDGISNFYSIPIEGMNEYRLQTSTDRIDLANAILEAGIEAEPGEDGKVVPVEAEGLDPADQEAFWKYLPEAGEQFAQEIIDYVNSTYAGTYFEGMFPGYTLDELAEDETLQAAFGMALWGFGGLKEPEVEETEPVEEETEPADEEETEPADEEETEPADEEETEPADEEETEPAEVVKETIFVDSTGTEYDLTTDKLDAKIYWDNLVAAYGYDLSDAGLNAEKAGDKTIQNYVNDLYFLKEGQIEGGVDSIAGITTTTEVGDDGVEREVINIHVNGIDPTAIFKFSVLVVPMHYYTEGYEGELNENGVDIGKTEFMQHLKDKNSKPVGAGPYIFQDYTDGVVTYVAFDDFVLGSPKIKNFRYQEITLGAELDALKTDTVHYADPSASTEIVNDVTAGEGDYAKLGYTLVDNDGYGYIGIQGQAFPDWNVRKAIAHALNVQLSVDNYYGELASVNYRTMTKVQWAYPDNPENLFPYDATGDTSKDLFLEAGYKYDEGANLMTYPEDHEKAGEQVTIKFTLPSAAEDHPAGSIGLDFQQVMEKIGVKVDIEVDQNLLGKLGTAYESGVQMWAAAWGSGGVDPDMFQIWHSDPAVNKADSPKGRGSTWLFQNGSDDQKAALVELNELIMAGRRTLDTEERREIYARALELSTGLAVEIPTYQRKNMFVYNTTVINADSLISGEDVTPFQSPLSKIWNVELND